MQHHVMLEQILELMDVKIFYFLKKFEKDPRPEFGGEKLVRTIGAIRWRIPFSPWSPSP
jgi:hypothetical protein